MSTNLESVVVNRDRSNDLTIYGQMIIFLISSFAQLSDSHYVAFTDIYGSAHENIPTCASCGNSMITGIHMELIHVFIPLLGVWLIAYQLYNNRNIFIKRNLLVRCMRQT